MSILSGPSIRNAVGSGDLGINPFDENAVGPATYDARLYHLILVSPSRLEEGQELDLDALSGKRYGIPPGRFVGVMTLEVLTMPLGIAARFGLKSEFTRQGLVAFGGIQIDPGFQGRLAISLFNAGPEAVELKSENQMFTIEFSMLDHQLRPEEGYQGEFQNQFEFHPKQRDFILNAQTVSLSEIGSLPSEVARLRQEFAILQRRASGQPELARPVSREAALEELAATQGHKRITDPEEFLGGWPAEENELDRFLAAVATEWDERE